jgi:glycosyltransferase involved in cell wall biosynthesis
MGRVMRKLGMRVEKERVAAPSPFVQGVHEKAVGAMLEVMRGDAGVLGLVTAAENQFTGELAMVEKGVKGRMYVCFHQPPSWMRLHWRDASVLDGLGGVVCLGSEQEAYFRGLRPGLRTIRIRHGVNLEFFSPGEERVGGEGMRLLFVGQWLRDFETLGEALPMIWREMPGVTVDCVIPREARHDGALLRLARDGRVRWHAGISPEALRGLYRGASLMFLPLIDAVANNAVVEALASGLPVVTSGVGEIGDYLPEGAGTMCVAGDAGAHAAAALGWLGDGGAREAAGRAGRAYAEANFNWMEIAVAMLAALREGRRKGEI